MDRGRIVQMPCLAVILVLLCGCGSSGGGSTGTTDTSALRGVPWTLVDSTPSMEFGATRSRGRRVNRFSGPYTVDGDSMKLGRSPRRRWRPPPADEIERRFVHALDSVRQWQATHRGARAQRRRPQGAAAVPVASVTGSWEATSFLQGDAIKSAIVGTR